MTKKNILLILLISSISVQAQILGGGTTFSTAVTFNQSWLSGCPSGSTTFSNQAAFEPTTAMDACAPAPACATGTTGSDVWFSFFAQSTTATIAVNPSASFNVAIQAFSGTSCPVLTNIGCADAGGINASETLILTGLIFNTRYYFRVFGAANGVSARTGTYTFCGSIGLGSTVLPVVFSSFNAFLQNKNVVLNWSTASESNNSYFEIERSINGNQFEAIGKVQGNGTTQQTSHYSFIDLAPFTETNFYRLKQVDINNRYNYSTIVKVKGNGFLRKEVKIFPNPVSGKINISISSDVSSTGVIKITDALGRTIYQRNERLVKGENVLTLNNLQNLSKGSYTLRVMIDNEILSTKFISDK